MPNPFLYKKQMDTTYIDSATSFDTWVDQSDNSLDLTAQATNEPAFNYGDADSEYNPFLRFNGIDHRVEKTDDADLDITGSLTLECIARNDVATLTAEQTLMSKILTAGDQRSYFLGIDSAGKLECALYSAGSAASIGREKASSAATDSDEWHHYAAVYDASTQTVVLYIDGVAITSTTDSGSIPASIHSGTADFNIGALDNPILFWDGDIALGRIWNRALSFSEVIVQYNGGDFWQQTVPTADQWGSQTQLITDSTDGDFADANIGNWVFVGTGGANGTCVYDAGPGAVKTALVTVGAVVGTTSKGSLPSGNVTALVEGKRYKFETDIYIEAGHSFTSVDTLIQGMSETSVEITTANLATVDAFQHISYEFIAGSDVAGNYQVIGTGGATGDKLYFDNIKITQVGAITEWRLAHENAFSPFEFEKSRFLPVEEPINPNQIVGIAGGGQEIVDDLGDAEELFPIRIMRVTETNRDDFVGFFQDTTVNYSEKSITFVEEDATEHTSRLWPVGSFPNPIKGRGGLFNFNLTLRKVIT